jgi:CheY-like chemotaxis protein
MPAERILVVEDDEAVRRLLIETLGSHAPLNVEGARDGVEALHQVLTRRYDTVILDMVMPKMSGRDFLDSLAAMVSDPSLNFQGKPPQIIVVTSTPSDELPTDAIEQRYQGLVKAVFRKPLDVGALMSLLDH